MEIDNETPREIDRFYYFNLIGPFCHIRALQLSRKEMGEAAMAPPVFLKNRYAGLLFLLFAEDLFGLARHRCYRRRRRRRRGRHRREHRCGLKL